MPLSNAQRQARWRKRNQGNQVRVCISVPPDVAAELRALEKWLRDPDVRITSVTLQDWKTGKLVSKRL